MVYNLYGEKGIKSKIGRHRGYREAWIRGRTRSPVLNVGTEQKRFPEPSYSKERGGRRRGERKEGERREEMEGEREREGEMEEGINR